MKYVSTQRTGLPIPKSEESRRWSACRHSNQRSGDVEVVVCHLPGKPVMDRPNLAPASAGLFSVATNRRNADTATSPLAPRLSVWACRSLRSWIRSERVVGRLASPPRRNQPPAAHCWSPSRQPRDRTAPNWPGANGRPLRGCRSRSRARQASRQRAQSRTGYGRAAARGTPHRVGFGGRLASIRVKRAS